MSGIAVIVVALVSLTLAVFCSLLPRPWRARFDLEYRLPLAAGTAISAAIGLLCGLLAFGHAYLAGTGPLVEYLSPLALLTLWLVICLDATVRLVNAVALWAPLGSLPLWLLERAIALGCTGVRRLRHRHCSSTLPPARVLSVRGRPGIDRPFGNAGGRAGARAKDRTMPGSQVGARGGSRGVHQHRR